MNEFERLRRLSVGMKKEYPTGTRLLLNYMDDPYSPVDENIHYGEQLLKF